MGIVKKNKSILVISDTHFPYQHPDTIAFLAEIKRVYKPDRVIHIGDEIDGHSISFHPKDPNLYAPSDEFKRAIELMSPLYDMFPKVDIVESNHGSLVQRRAKSSGLPIEVIKPYREILKAPRGWKWHFDLTIKASDGRSIYFTHGKTSVSGGLSKSMGMNTVQGHYHEKFEIIRWSNTLGTYWDLRVGCLVDDHSLAFNYNNTNLKRPSIGTGIILDGEPRLLPLIMDKKGRWIGKLK